MVIKGFSLAATKAHKINEKMQEDLQETCHRHLSNFHTLLL